MTEKIKVIAFDADDTLWDCQGYFEEVENHLYRLLAPYCEDPKKELFKTESGNMADLGSTPLPGVEETLKELRKRLCDTSESGSNFLTLHSSLFPKLVCFTKGELQDQENKLKRSGLLKYFDDVEITSDKTQREFLALCEHQGIHPSELLMIGNSLKSDCAPALAIGAWAIHIPFHVTWQLEHFEDIDHERLIKVDKISDILKYI